jgi:hypothetical protein
VPKRWVRVGVLALVIFVVNGLSRFITWKADIVKDTEQLRLGLVALAFVTLIIAVATGWWAVRYPFGRIFADVGAAVGIGGLLSVLIGPFLGGATPFAGGLGFFVGQVLMFAGLAAVGVFLGYVSVVALGKDWKSRGLKRYEEIHAGKRSHKTVRR